MTTKLIDKLLAEATTEKTRHTLLLINEVCKTRYESGETDFSFVAIAGADKGIPKAQSLRNKSGILYRQIINYWSSKVAKPKSRNDRQPLDWIKNISDPSLRYLVVDLYKQKQDIAAQLSLFKKLGPLEIDMRNMTNTQELQKEKLVATELCTLEEAISKNNLEKRGWSIGQRGSIEDESGNTIFGRGFVNAIQKILNSHF